MIKTLTSPILSLIILLSLSSKTQAKWSNDIVSTYKKLEKHQVPLGDIFTNTEDKKFLQMHKLEKVQLPHVNFLENGFEFKSQKTRKIQVQVFDHYWLVNGYKLVFPKTFSIKILTSKWMKLEETDHASRGPLCLASFCLPLHFLKQIPQAVAEDFDDRASLIVALAIAKLTQDPKAIADAERAVFWATKGECERRNLMVFKDLEKLSSERPIKEVQCLQNPENGIRRVKGFRFITKPGNGEGPYQVDLQLDYQKSQYGDFGDVWNVAGARVQYSNPVTGNVIFTDYLQRFENGEYIGLDSNFNKEVHETVPPQTHLAQYRLNPDGKVVAREFAMVRSEKTRVESGPDGKKVHKIYRKTHVEQNAKAFTPKLLELKSHFGSHQVYKTLRLAFGLATFGSSFTYSNCCNESSWEVITDPKSNHCQRFIENPNFCKEQDNIQMVEDTGLQGPITH